MTSPNSLAARWTIREILRWTCDFFKKKGIETSRLDAELLLAHALGTDRLRLYLNYDAPLSLDERERFRALVRRRAGREPVSLILGRRDFWSFSVKVVPGVLTPRPETEVLVETALFLLRHVARPKVLEIGTGSGAVAAALAAELPDAWVLATDIDETAACSARDNVRSTDMKGHVSVMVSDTFSAIKPGAGFDLICSNPPYIRSADIDGLPPEVSQFEPRLALDGGADGFDFIRRLAIESEPHLAPGGFLCMEIGADQKSGALAILAGEGFADTLCFPDLAGRPRVVVGRRP
jgi:release factor glutamine methyltransferase